MHTTRATPRTFWRIFKTVDGQEKPYRAMPHAYKNPGDLVPAIKHLRSAGHNVCIKPVPFTPAKAVTAIMRGASVEHIQALTGWSEETMADIELIARLRVDTGI